MENKSHTPLAVFTITEREKDGKKFWVRLGTAFRNRDGSLNATLDGMPTNGMLHIREVRPNDASREGPQRAAETHHPAEEGTRWPSARRGEPHLG